ncbi:MAG: hypothetical protein AB1449_14850 [Chloroflexota bacterium]
MSRQRKSSNARILERNWPAYSWPLWKLLALAIPAFAAWSALPLIVPPHFSEWAVATCGALFVSGLGSTLWLYICGYNPWVQAIAAFSLLPGVFTLLATRTWLYALPITWEWLLPLWVAVILAALLPFTAPKLSKFLWTEQTAPRTRVGRAFMAICLAAAPTAGTLGAAWGMYGSRFLGDQPTALGLAVLTSVTAVGFGFIASYNVVEWRQKQESASSQTR